MDTYNHNFTHNYSHTQSFTQIIYSYTGTCKYKVKYIHTCDNTSMHVKVASKYKHIANESENQSIKDNSASLWIVHYYKYILVERAYIYS